ncbi:MAG TPA: hypothetical protein VFV28_09025, partial [Limnobacter sp.]|nr:hypothetical protein [Limnobacter sp.]
DLVHIPEEIDLTVRACRAFYQHASLCSTFRVRIRVNKNTPEQAGLGGGSSNAATVLRLLQQHHGYPLTKAEMSCIALSLGADVPFFLQDQCAFVEGIGENLTPIHDISGHLLVYKPPVSCPTGKIFNDSELTRNASDVKIAVFDSVSRADGGLMPFLKAHTQNALQTVVARMFPQWEQFYSEFSRCVAGSNPQLVRMSGSGSAMFAVFASPSQLSSAVAAVAEAPELKAGCWFECQIRQGQTGLA